MILERTLQRERNSVLIRSRTSPEVTAILKGRVFDQLGAVRLSFRILSRISGATGVERKSRVLLREAKNCENSSGLIMRELYRTSPDTHW
jgi:hypothetical protein